jgi:helix-turn-helix protein
MWALFEPVHAVIYFSPVARAAFEEVGLRGFWRGYFAGRAAPLGPVPAAPVVGAFFSFAPAMVERAIPDVWQRATPQQALAARQRGAVAALTPLAEALSASQLREAVTLLEAAVDELEPAGHVLGAANAALPRPEQPLQRLWQATTTLREHRGDGHLAALVTAGLRGCEALVLRAGQDLPRELLQAARGWTDEQWDAAARRLVERGWLDLDGRATAKGISGYETIEAQTDALAVRPWTALGSAASARLTALLSPLSAACRAHLPTPNPIGLPVPSGRG